MCFKNILFGIYFDFINCLIEYCYFSGAIEQDADIVMFLYREDYYKKDTENINKTEVIIFSEFV